MRIPLLQPLLDWGRGLIRKLTVSRQTGGGRSWRNSRTYRTWRTLALARATGEFTGQISRREWAPCSVASLYRGGWNLCHRIVSRNDSRARLFHLTSRKKRAHLLYDSFSWKEKEKKEEKAAILYYYVNLLTWCGRARLRASKCDNIDIVYVSIYRGAASKNNPARSGAVTAQNISHIFHDIREEDVFTKKSVFQNFKFSRVCARTRVRARPSRCCVIRNECK